MPNEALAAVLADGLNMMDMVVDWHISLFSALFGNLLPNSRVSIELGARLVIGEVGLVGTQIQQVSLVGSPTECDLA